MLKKNVERQIKKKSNTNNTILVKKKNMNWIKFKAQVTLVLLQFKDGEALLGKEKILTVHVWTIKLGQQHTLSFTQIQMASKTRKKLYAPNQFTELSKLPNGTKFYI